MTGDGKVSSRGIDSLLCIIVFEKLTDKSIIAILNTMKREFAHNGYRFYDFIQGGILHTLEINRKVNFGWLFGVKTGGRKEYIYAGEKFKEIALERYKKLLIVILREIMRRIIRGSVVLSDGRQYKNGS